ncbi:hypothetical protein [Variovorax ginsengisoli]|uniref:Uncharacterized protein n=1 Tax=Variovorax ginsengisoli TaxID=363844 RepID=A0ABT9S6R3_9BURK|nr:hypothetical protein [Variovorax ginsengisoli]MDP9899553.1 hypothetical protein [Variovorax ginsengisoli]
MARKLNAVLCGALGVSAAAIIATAPVAHAAASGVSILLTARAPASDEHRLFLRHPDKLAAAGARDQEWTARLDRYAAASEAEQAQLRENLFNDTERLRLSGALAMRASAMRKPAGNGG